MIKKDNQPRKVIELGNIVNVRRTRGSRTASVKISYGKIWNRLSNQLLFLELTFEDMNEATRDLSGDPHTEMKSAEAAMVEKSNDDVNDSGEVAMKRGRR